MRLAPGGAPRSDDKIVAVSVRDPSYSDYTDKAQLPNHVLRQVRRFFEDYIIVRETPAPLQQAA